MRLDYDDIVEAGRAESALTVLCDLQQGINHWTGNDAVMYAGSPQHKFNLWIPERDSAHAQRLLTLIKLRYGADGKRNYVYVSGKANLFRDKPQIVLTDISQLSDRPPGG